MPIKAPTVSKSRKSSNVSNVVRVQKKKRLQGPRTKAPRTRGGGI